MSYKNIAEQIDRHRTNPDDEKVRRGAVDHLLYKTRNEKPAAAAATLRTEALKYKVENSIDPTTGMVWPKKRLELARKLKAVANRLEGVVVKKEKKRPHIKTKTAPTQQKKKK